MKKTSKHYFVDIIDYCERIIDDIQYLSLEEFLRNQLLIDGTERRIEVIGELVKRLPEDVWKEKDIPWNKIIRTRDFLAHHYDTVIPERLYMIAIKDIPRLLDKAKSYI